MYQYKYSAFNISLTFMDKIKVNFLNKLDIKKKNEKFKFIKLPNLYFLTKFTISDSFINSWRIKV